MLIYCITVAGDMAIINQFNENLIINLKGLSNYKGFPSKSPHASKCPKIKPKHNCDLTQNSQNNHLCRAPSTPLKELLQNSD